jgi:hypothetical protein
MDSDAVFTDDQAARKQIATGVLPADRARADYNNINFAILQRHVFEPAGVDDARCAPVPGAALAYPPVQDTDRAVHGQEVRGGLGWECSTDGRTPGLRGKLGVGGVHPAAILTHFDIVKDRLPVVVVITSDPGLEKRFLIQNALTASTTH